MNTLNLRDPAFLAPSGGGAPSAPPSLSTLKLWFDAGVGVLDTGASPASDGDDVGTWENQGGTTDATSTAGNRPTYHTGQINGLPIIRFNASEFMSIAHGTDSDVSGPQGVWWAVMKPNSLTPFNWIITKMNVAPFSGTYEFYIAASTGRLAFTAQTPASQDSGANFLTAGVFSKVFVRNDSVSGCRIYIDSTTAKTTGSYKTGPSYATPAEIGRRSDPNYSDQDIAEFGVYHGAISDADFALLDTYITGKYGI